MSNTDVNLVERFLMRSKRTMALLSGPLNIRQHYGAPTGVNVCGGISFHAHTRSNPRGLSRPPALASWTALLSHIHDSSRVEFVLKPQVKPKHNAI
ncbi:hypothetical protein A0H81_11246 [Grifola frondosa]|uniref:Uncharacterized protein n=1 Tax=Grifola frondosa TaxID=5627 RepID=A0A1C7LXY6_GRIFR|nr:hypothetical protein A0H81_11246 [Grifola frondosa]